MTAALSRLGFDPARFGFAMRTALAACLALLVARGLGLDHPQWSAMTVWAAAQPVRGMLVEKGLFRAIGTAIGVVAGVALVAVAHGEPVFLVAGLALWIGFCAGLGNVLRGFLSYGAMLAGYSAAMVALLDTPHPDHILALGLDRFLTVMTGVVMAVLVGLACTPGAAVEEALDGHGAGSLRLRRAARGLRRLVVAQVALLLWQPDRADPDAAVILDRAADALDAGTPPAAAALLLEPMGEQGPLAALAAALAGTAPGGGAEIVVHRDWVGARQAAIRAFATSAMVGALWLGTGWPGGAYMLLGTSVMISLFSTSDNPAATMRFVAFGQLAGVMAALACRWLAWPHGGSGLDLMLMVLPFVLFGALPVAHRRTMAGGFDFNLAMLLLLQPAFPLAGTFETSVLTAAAVVAGPVLAWAAFRMAYPADARRRRDMLVAMMVHELQTMAARTDAPRRRLIWQARLHHRLLRLVRWTEKAGEAGAPTFEGSLAVLRLGQVILQLQAHAASPRIAVVLRRLRRLAREPERASRALDLLARRPGPAEAAPVAEAARALAANSGFFRRTA